MMEKDDIGILQAVVAEIFPERMIEKADNEMGLYHEARHARLKEIPIPSRSDAVRSQTPRRIIPAHSGRLAMCRDP